MNHQLLKNRDIVVFGITNWDTDGNKVGINSKKIAFELAGNNRILFVNTPLDRATYIKKEDKPETRKKFAVLKGEHPELEMVQENIWNFYPNVIIESINWINNAFIFDYINKINNERFAAQIKKAMDSLGFRNVILFNDNDFFRGYYLKELLNPDLYVYYMRDFFTGVKYWERHGTRLEPKLVEKSDLILTNSPYYADYCGKFNSESYYVGQGCNVSGFDVSNDYTPGDIKSIKGPIIGYVGALKTLRLDINIIRHIAETRPDWSVVLIGNEDEVFSNSDLHKKSNVHFLGLKPIEEIPYYIKSMDVCINPQAINKVTIGNYPLKIDEYLLMGKPVVATKTKAMEVFKDYVYLASDYMEYPEFIEKALSENNEELSVQRKHFASAHTWENCTLKVGSYIQQKIWQKRAEKKVAEKIAL